MGRLVHLLPIHWSPVYHLPVHQFSTSFAWVGCLFGAHVFNRWLFRLIHQVLFQMTRSNLSDSKMWCVDLSDRAVQNDDSEYRPSTALIWRADRHVRRLALMTVEFDHWECRASNSMLSTVDRQAPTILAWRMKVLWTSFPLSREICCSVKAVSDA